MEQNEAPLAEQPVPTTQRGIFIAVDDAEGGAVMIAQWESGRRSAIVAGDKDSDTFKRKVQRTAVKWVKGFFTAPPRKKKEEQES